MTDGGVEASAEIPLHIPTVCCLSPWSIVPSGRGSMHKTLPLLFAVSIAIYAPDINFPLVKVVPSSLTVAFAILVPAFREQPAL